MISESYKINAKHACTECVGVGYYVITGHRPGQCISVPEQFNSQQMGGSLVPKASPSVCIHNNTRERKTSEKPGRPGSIYHVNDMRWTQSGRSCREKGQYSNM